MSQASIGPLICPRDFPRGASGKESACWCRRHKKHGFDPWVGKIPWRRPWQPTPILLPGESPWTEEPGRLQSTGSQRAGHNWSNLADTICAKHWGYSSEDDSPWPQSGPFVKITVHMSEALCPIHYRAQCMVIITTFTIIENTDLMYTIIFSNLSYIVIFTTTEKNPLMPQAQKHPHTPHNKHTTHFEGICFISQSCLWHSFLLACEFFAPFISRKS